MRTPAAGSSRLSGNVSLSKNDEAAVVHRHVDDVAVAEAEQDALLDPGVDTPAGGGAGVGLGRAHLAARERFAQLGKRGPRLAVARGSACREELLDTRAQPGERLAHAWTAAGAALTAASTRASLSRVSARGGTIGSR